MTTVTRRSVLRNSLAVAAAGTVARPFIAHAQAKTATVWWTQGFVPEEDAAFRKMVDDYQKQSGNTIDYSLIPFALLMQKIVSAITSGDVPDLVSHDINMVSRHAHQVIGMKDGVICCQAPPRCWQPSRERIAAPPFAATNRADSRPNC